VIVRDTTRARIRMRVRDVIPAMMREKKKKVGYSRNEGQKYYTREYKYPCPCLVHEQEGKKKEPEGERKGNEDHSQVRSDCIHDVEHLLWPDEETSRFRIRSIRYSGRRAPQPLGSIDIQLITLPLQALHRTIHDIKLPPPNGPIVISIIPLGSTRSNVEIPNPTPRTIVPLSAFELVAYPALPHGHFHPNPRTQLALDFPDVPRERPESFPFRGYNAWYPDF